MDLDANQLKDHLSLADAPTIHSQLCRSQISSFEKAVSDDAPLIVACTQEAPLFQEVAEEKGEFDIAFTNIRENAGWCEAKKAVYPKIAALLAEAAHPSKPTGLTTIHSEGLCLVYGGGQAALEVAEQLASRLSVSLILTETSDVIPPTIANVPIYQGRITRASGTLGSFEISVDNYAPMVPSSKTELSFLMARDGFSSKCDLILDMSGGTPFFASVERRDGYFYVDPKHPVAIAKAMFEITDLVGEFEKPLYVTYNADICAHGRNEKIGCTNCLDHCPVSAIMPDGDRISINHAVCGGCGNCSASCPTGAVSYAYPARDDLIGRCQILLSTYLNAGGKDPVLLIHDDKHGAPLISAIARYGRGLPPHILPLASFTTTQLGHEVLGAALTAGAQQIVILASPEKSEEQAALEGQVTLVNHLMNGLGYDGKRIHVLSEQDPDIVEGFLYDQPKLSGIQPQTFTAIGGKRDIARTIFAKLNESAPNSQDILDLPEGAPYGHIQIDKQGCTLCLACVSACPASALTDNPDRPELRFVEQACVQCGLCKATCPEKVIALEPRYNFSNTAMTAETLNEEQPFECVSCGKPFGVKSSVERVINELKGKHWMFQSEEQVKLIQMCEDCRVQAVSESGQDPFQSGERPRVRTTEDYLVAEGMAKKTGKTPDDFLK